MRLFPRSIFLRLVLILLVVLFLAQLLSAGLHLQDRGQVLYHSAGLNSAERIAGIVRLLDPMSARERERAVAALDVPALRISLDQAVWPREARTHMSEYTALLYELLRSYLGDERTINVLVQQTPLLESQFPYLIHLHPVLGDEHRQKPQAGMQTGDDGLILPSGISFLARVKLQDGKWISFDHRIPEEVFGWSKKLIWSLIILLISTVAVVLLAVRWVTRPIATLSRAADDLGRDIRHPPLPEKGSIEVIRAAQAFNKMQARIIQFIQDRSRIVAAVSHDLKTPITRLRLRAEMLEEREIKRKFLSDLDEMQILVQETLDFMRGMDRGEPVQSVDINALLDSLQADEEEIGHHTEIVGSAGSPYSGSPLALKRCLSNLLGNAFKYAGDASVRIKDAPDELRIYVMDNGPGIPQNELEKVFDPYFRVEGSRNRDTGGTGLGLSIARDIARAHGGNLVLNNRTEGGLEAILSLPR